MFGEKNQYVPSVSCLGTDATVSNTVTTGLLRRDKPMGRRDMDASDDFAIFEQAMARNSWKRDQGGVVGAGGGVVDAKDGAQVQMEADARGKGGGGV